MHLQCHINIVVKMHIAFTRDYFDEKKIEKNIKFSGGNIFLYRGYCQKIGVRICRNSFIV